MMLAALAANTLADIGQTSVGPVRGRVGLNSVQDSARLLVSV